MWRRIRGPIVLPLVGLLLAAGLVACGTPAGPGGHGVSRRADGALLVTVRPGDSVSAIALQYGAAWRAVAAANGIEPPYLIYPGQVLVVPQSAMASRGATRMVARAAPPPSRPAPARTATRSAPARAGAMPASRPAAPSAPSTAASTATSKPTRPDAVALLAPPHVGAGFQWPVVGRLIAGFGPDADGRHNAGINIAVPRGTAVRAAQAGEVVFADSLRGYGKLLLVRHPDGWVTAYGHNDVLLVARGEPVEQGQVIALAGDSGAASEPQVHFELRRGKQAVDPLPYLPPPDFVSRDADRGGRSSPG